MGENLMEDRSLGLHDNPQHYSNWCRKCGLYYCWHKEAPKHERDCRAIGHVFESMKDNNDKPKLKREYWDDEEDE
jgi:hypothetical protein